MFRRVFCLMPLAPFVVSARSVFAQNKKGICLIVPFPPGGGGDRLARANLERLAKKLEESVWVANRPGAGGSIGAGIVATSVNDGKTLGYVTNGIMAVNPYLYKNKILDPENDLIPVGQISRIGLVLALNPRAIKGVTDYKSLVEYATEHPNKVDFASSGVGTSSHLAGLYFAKEQGIKLHHIPHAGGASAILEVLSGRIPIMIDVLPNVLPHVKKGALKALAVTTDRRIEALPNAPTLKEFGLKNLELYAWDGLVLPKGTNQNILRKYSQAFASLAQDEEARKAIENMGAEPVFSDSEQFGRFIKTEIPKWRSLVEQIGVPNH